MITCPKCHHSFPLEDSLLEEKLLSYKASLKESFEKEFLYQKKFLEKNLEEKDKKIQDFYEKELELRKQLDLIKEKEKNIDVLIQRKLEEEKLQVMKQVQQEFYYKILEKDKKIQDIEQKLQEAQRTVYQDSQQRQGEAFEKDFFLKLKENFPQDLIEEVAIGREGADLKHSIIYEGKIIGKVLWELKQTKNFSEKWIDKLEQNMLQEKAIFSCLVTKTFPKDIKFFDQRESIYILDPSLALTIFKILRESFIKIYLEKKLFSYQDEKLQFFFQYLTGTDFKNHLKRIAQTFSSLKEELEKEKIHQQKYWAKQEKILELALLSTSKISGDLEALTGNQLLEEDI